MNTPQKTDIQGLTINKKILLPFLCILIFLGLAAAIGSVRLISNAFTEETGQELLMAREMIEREIKEKERLLRTFSEMLISSHYPVRDPDGLRAAIESTVINEGELSAKLITDEDPDVLSSPLLQQLILLAKRSHKPQLRVAQDNDGVPSINLVQPIENSQEQLLIKVHLDQNFLFEVSAPLQVNTQILSLESQVLVTTDVDDPQPPILSEQELNTILSGGLIFKEGRRGADTRYLFCAVPLGTTDLIMLAINRPMGAMVSTISSMTTHSAATVLAVLLLGGYLFFSLVRRVMAPLNDLTHATREISAGNLDYRVSVNSRDEFGLLANSFNSMVNELESLYGQKVSQEKSLALAKEELKYKELLEAKNKEIERANHELRIHLKEMSALFNLNQAMASSLEIGVLFDRMISVLKDLLHCNRIVLFTYNRGNEELIVRKTFGVDKELIQGTVFRLDEGITGRAAVSQEMIYIPDLLAEGRNLNYKGRMTSEGSMISIPLLIKDRLSGVLNLHKFENNAFSPSDLKLVQAIANQAAVAIENSQLYEKARNLSNTDELTGLANRRHFQLILKREVAQAQRFHSHFALIMADLDNFKAYNDTHGHLKGDILLKKVSRILLQNTRGIDLVARFGGEEFVVLLPKTETEGARSAAEKLRVAIMAENFDGIEQSHPGGALTISMGVSEYPSDCKDVYELLDLADRALYRAKDGGRNRVVAWSDPPRELVAENYVLQ